jgi:hypothetical protein
VGEHEEEEGEEVDAEAAQARPDMPAARPKSEGREKAGRWVLPNKARCTAPRTAWPNGNRVWGGVVHEFGYVILL